MVLQGSLELRFLLKLPSGSAQHASLTSLRRRWGPAGDPERLPELLPVETLNPEPHFLAFVRIVLGQLTVPRKNRKKMSETRCGAADSAVMDPDKAMNHG